ncbi:MAG: hypothetical protein ABW208_24400, partial [Pyrinomonadaceae bacterium]
QLCKGNHIGSLPSNAANHPSQKYDEQRVGGRVHWLVRAQRMLAAVCARHPQEKRQRVKGATLRFTDNNSTSAARTGAKAAGKLSKPVAEP